MFAAPSTGKESDTHWGGGVEPDRVGRRTVEAIKRGEREVYITLFDRLLVLIATLFPGLFQWALIYVTRYRRKQFEEGGSPGE